MQGDIEMDTTTVTLDLANTWGDSLADQDVSIQEMFELTIEDISGNMIMPPQASSIEAEYNEQYILWAGPIMITKYLHKSEPLLSDFTDSAVMSNPSDMVAQDADIPYPFRYQIEKWKKDEQ